MKIDDLGEEIEEEEPVAVGTDDVATFVAARGDVPNGTRVLETKRTRHGSKREGEVKIQDSALRPGVGVGRVELTRNKLGRGGEPLKFRIFELRPREFSELPRSGLVQRPGAHRRRPRRDDDTTRSTVTQRSASGASAKHGQCSNDTNSCRPER